MCVTVSCHPSRVTNKNRSRPGSSTTRGFPRKAATRSVWHDNIAVSWASRTTARLQSACRWRRQGSLPVAYRLYLPKEWADDPARRSIAGVPNDVGFQTKPEIALQQLRQALVDGVPRAPVLMDPAYGNDSKLRAGISELELTYVAGILPTTMVWRPWRSTVATGAQNRPRSARQAAASRRDTSSRLSQDIGTGACRRCLAADHVARRQQYAADFAVMPVGGCVRRATTPGAANPRPKSGG